MLKWIYAIYQSRTDLLSYVAVLLFDTIPLLFHLFSKSTSQLLLNISNLHFEFPFNFLRYETYRNCLNVHIILLLTITVNTCLKNCIILYIFLVLRGIQLLFISNCDKCFFSTTNAQIAYKVPIYGLIPTMLYHNSKLFHLRELVFLIYS